MRTKLLLSLLALLVLVPASPASAKSSIRVGVADQSPAMFDSPYFQELKIKRTRYFIPADVMRDPAELARATAFVTRARSAGVSTLIHVSTSDLRAKRGPIVSTTRYRTDVGRLVAPLPRARRARLRRLERGQPQDAGDVEPRRQRRLVLQKHVQRRPRALHDVRRRRPRHARPGRLGPLHPLVLRAPEPDMAPAREDRRHPQLLRRQPQPLDRHEEDHRHRPALQQAREVLVHRDRRAGELRQIVPLLRVTPGIADEATCSRSPAATSASAWSACTPTTSSASRTGRAAAAAAGSTPASSTPTARRGRCSRVFKQKAAAYSR